MEHLETSRQNTSDSYYSFKIRKNVKAKALPRILAFILFMILPSEGNGAISWYSLPKLIHEAPTIVKGKIDTQNNIITINIEKTLKGKEYRQLTVLYLHWFEVPDPKFEDGEDVLLFLYIPDHTINKLLFPTAPTPKEGQMYLFGLGEQAKWPRRYPEKPEPHEYYHHYPKLQDTASLEAIQDVIEKLLKIEKTPDLDEKVKLCTEYIKSPNRLLQFTAMEYAIQESLWAPPPEKPYPSIPHEIAYMRNNILKNLAYEVLSLSLVDSNEPSIRAEAILFLGYAELNKVVPLLIQKITDEDKNVRSNTWTVLKTFSLEMKITGDFIKYKHDDSVENLKSIQQKWYDWWQLELHKSKAEEQEYKQDMARIKAVEASFKPGQVNNLEEYEKFADEIQKKWSQRNKEYNARLILDLCGPLSSGTFPGDRRYDVAKKFALSVLEKSEEISVEMELEFTGHVVTIMYTPNSPKGEDFAQRRKKDVEVRFHAWKRLLDSIDPNWDPNEKIWSPNAVAIKLGLSDSGMAPENVKDPKLRAEYEAALEKNRQDIERHTKQYRLHNWLRRFPKRAEEYIILAYSEPPFNLEELKQYLEKYKIDEKTKARITESVQNNIKEQTKEMPDVFKKTINSVTNLHTDFLPCYCWPLSSSNFRRYSFSRRVASRSKT